MNEKQELPYDEVTLDSGLEWAAAIQHPLDRRYLKKIEGIPLLPKVMGWVVDKMRESQEAMLAGDGVLVTPISLPVVYGAFKKACDALNLNVHDFRLFVNGEQVPNAFSIGSKIPMVVATNGLVESLNEKELIYVFGHELGHYICGHCRCHALAGYLANAVDLTPAWILGLGIRPLLMQWSRYSELSADRAGLLACNDLETVCSAFLKICGFPKATELPRRPSEVFYEQANAYSKISGEIGTLHRLWREISHGLSADHPRTVERFVALDDWNSLGMLDELNQASYSEKVKLANEISRDYSRNELMLLAVAAVASYFEQKLSMPRKTSMPLLRRAFINKASLKGTVLEAVARAELGITKGKNSTLTYFVEVLVLTGGKQAKRLTIPIDYSDDWDFAPEAIRKRFIEGRDDEIRVLLYSVK